MAETLNVNIDWVQGIQFKAQVREEPEVTLDYPPPLGSGNGITPLEMLLVSLGTCAGATVAMLLGRMNRTVSGMRVQAGGLRRDTHPTCFARITLDFTLSSPDVTDGEFTRALNLAEGTYCPVWAMIKGNVEVVTTYHLEGSSTFG